MRAYARMICSIVRRDSFGPARLIASRLSSPVLLEEGFRAIGGGFVLADEPAIDWLVRVGAVGAVTFGGNG